MRARVLFVCSVMLIACGVGVVAQLPPPPLPQMTLGSQPPSKLGPILQAVPITATGQTRVIVQAVDAVSVSQLPSLIAAVGGVPGRPLPIINAQAAVLPNAAVSVLAASSLVARIAADRPAAATDERTNETVGSLAVQQAYGYDGSGVGIAVIDSGVTPAHDDLTDASGVQRVVNFVDFVNDRSTAYDDFGHGTHVAGIIAGNGFDSAGSRAGIAPAAALLVLKVLDGSGQGRISDLIAAFDYILANRSQYSIRAVNVSIGAGVYESYDTDLLTVAAKRLVEAGIIVVAAAGNNGTEDGTTEYGGITAPGNAPWVLTVGASTHNGTADRSDDAMAPFSSRGPTAYDDAAKPDLVAPGVGIESLSSPGSTMYTTRAAALLPGTIDPGYLPYLSLSGTSQATPVVTGTVALMMQADPSLTPNLVKAILQYTAQIYPGYDALTQGAGFLNALGAVELARVFGGATGWNFPRGAPWGGQIIWGNYRITGGFLSPNANAWDADVEWGAPTRGLNPIVWGLIFNGPQNTWSPWGTSCSDLTCSSVTWGSPNSENVVWGSQCGGANCPSNTLVPGASLLFLWSPTSSDTIVWGTSDGESDTIVWGTSCDPTCE